MSGNMGMQYVFKNFAADRSQRNRAVVTWGMLGTFLVHWANVGIFPIMGAGACGVRFRKNESKYWADLGGSFL